MLGDLLFFKSRGSIPDRLVCWRTKGPFVHVEIDLGDGTSVAALPTGVVRHAAPGGDHIVRAETSKLLKEPQRVMAAKIWLLTEVGHRYGWIDIVDQGWSLMFPDGPFLYLTNEKDCSDLAASFLWTAGYDLIADMLETPMVSPNSLARALGVTG